MSDTYNISNSMNQLQITTQSPEETQTLGRHLGKLTQGGELVLMTGGLGAGKTCLTQGIAWGLGVQEHARSPTFVLVSEYQGRHTLYHVDLYRIDDILEMEELGLEEIFAGDGVCVIEWAEKAEPILPPEHLRISMLVTGPEERAITITANGPGHLALLDKLKTSYASRGTVRSGA